MREASEKYDSQYTKGLGGKTSGKGPTWMIGTYIERLYKNGP